ncbi:hypothetical protein, partial [Escherichia coli]
KQQLPFTPGGTHCPEPDVTLRDLTLSPGYHSDYAPQPIPEMDSSAVVPPTNENTSPPEDTPDNTPAGGNTGQAEKTRNAGLTPIPEKRSGMPPEHLRFATGFPPQPKIAGPKGKPMRTVHPDKIYREIIWFCSGYLRKSGPEATRTIINSIFCEWASIFNDYSSPFSWVDSRDSEQCDWLWNAMQVRCVGTPLNPLTPEQKYWFACATFDNWEGWNEQQVQFLLESNPRRNRAKFTQASFQAPRIQHKAILLDELKSAREQQKRRDERADGSVPLKLSGKIHKQPESIARSRGVLPKKLLNEMIEQAYQDFVANEQHKTLS